MYADLVSAGRKRSVKERLNGVSAEEPLRIMFSNAKRQCRREWMSRNNSFKDNKPAVSYKLHPEDLRHKLRRKGLQQQIVSKSYLAGKSEKLPAAFHQLPIKSKKLAGYKHQMTVSNKYKAAAGPPLNPVPVSLNKIPQKKMELSVDRFLQLLGLEKFLIAFKVEEVDMADLKHMTDLETIGLPMGPWKKILLALRPKTQGCQSLGHLNGMRCSCVLMKPQIHLPVSEHTDNGFDSG